MDVSDAIQHWRSTRKFENRDVADEKIRAVIDAGRHAPSWENAQPWHFIVVRNNETKEMLSKLAMNQKHVARAPVIVVCCGDVDAWKHDRQRNALVELREKGGAALPDDLIDNVILKNPVFTPALLGSDTVLLRTLEQLSIAVGFMCLEAVNQGLGCCIVGAFGNELTRGEQELYAKVRARLGLPPNLIAMTILTLGFPADSGPQRPRKELTSILSAETIGEAFPGGRRS